MIYSSFHMCSSVQNLIILFFFFFEVLIALVQIATNVLFVIALFRLFGFKKNLKFNCFFNFGLLVHRE